MRVWVVTDDTTDGYADDVFVDSVWATQDAAEAHALTLTITSWYGHKINNSHVEHYDVRQP